jgi:Zn-dependent protease
MDFTPEQIRFMFAAMFILIASIALHEFGHAIVAKMLGDDTPVRQGRVTLNPIAHADPIGTLVLPLLGLLFTAGQGLGFGWGKPVETQPRNYTRKLTMVTGQALVAFAGPMMNILLGTVVAAVHVGLLAGGVIDFDHAINKPLVFAVGLNFTLFFFNLIPVPPLDGGWIVQRFIPYKHRPAWERIAQYAPFFLLAVLLIPPIQKIFVVPATFCMESVYKAFSAVFGVPISF